MSYANELATLSGEERRAWYVEKFAEMDMLSRDERLELYKVAKEDETFPTEIIPPPPKGSDRGGTDEFEKLLKNGNQRCQAFSKDKLRFGLRGADAQCARKAKAGSTKCRFHDRSRNPRTLREEISRYKKDIPENMMARFLEAGKDPKRLSLEAEIDLVTTRIGQLLERIDSGQSERAWDKVAAAYAAIDKAVRTGDASALATGVTNLGAAIQESDYNVWSELVLMVQNRRVLVEAESKRQIQLAEVISIDQMMAVVARIQEVIFNIVIDHNLRVRLAAEFRALVAPDMTLLPGTGVVDAEYRDVGAASKGVVKNTGCEICRHEAYRERNKNSAGVFTCPACGAVWESQDNMVDLATVLPIGGG